MKVLNLFSDGGARGNPGPAGAAAIVTDEHGKTLDQFCAFLGKATNNEAEYAGLLLGIERAMRVCGKDCPQYTLNVFMDSELLVKQMRGEYKIKDPELQSFAIKVQGLRKDFAKVTFSHIPRAKNSETDALVNEAIDMVLKHLHKGGQERLF